MRNHAATPDRSTLARLQEQSLVERLNSANRRIAELERRERQLNFERDRLIALASMELEKAIDQRSDVEAWPAAGLDQLLSTLSIVQRRDAWLTALSRAGVGGSIATLFPHDGKDGDPITILVRGSGGYGDMLYLSHVARLLFFQFDRARIVILHEHPDAVQVFARNPFVLASLSLQGDAHQRLLRVAAALDIFDLIADVRYVVTYATPPLSRVPFEFLLAAHTRAAPWQRYVRREWPHLNNLLAREATTKGMSKYDLLAYTGNLPSSSREGGDFFFDPSASLSESIKSDAAYVTVHHGADRFMSGHDGLSTKNLLDATWADIVDRCRSAGLTTVQIGESREPQIQNVDVDLRGKTSFSETAVILKYAAVHVDTEGGLVHLAQAMGTCSVVAFGPTPVSFFGYANNVNLGPAECGNCWWISDDWARRCPRGIAEPICMKSHKGDDLANAAVKVALTRKVVSVRGAWLNLSLICKEIKLAGSLSTEEGVRKGGLLVVDSADSLADCVSEMGRHNLEYSLGVPESLFPEVVDATSFVEVLPYSSGHIPVRTSTCAWACISLQNSRAEVKVRIVHEALRALSPGATAYLITSAAAPREEAASMVEQLRRVPGDRLLLEVALDEDLAKVSDTAACLILSVGASTGSRTVSKQ